MLKRVICSILTVLLLTGCSSFPMATSSTNEPTSKAEQLAEQLVTDLQMENMSKVKSRTVLGMFLAGDKSLAEDYAAYLSDESGNADTVVVILSDKMDEVKKYMQDYLDEEQSTVAAYYPSEVFKVTNAILEENGEILILVIAADINTAKTLIENMLN